MASRGRRAARKTAPVPLARRFSPGAFIQRPTNLCRNGFFQVPRVRYSTKALSGCYGGSLGFLASQAIFTRMQVLHSNMCDRQQSAHIKLKPTRRGTYAWRRYSTAAPTRLARASLVLTGLIVIALGVTLDELQRSPWVTRQGQRPDQPVPFSHKHHVQGWACSASTAT